MMSTNPQAPTIFVIFGASGDLLAKKIAPALFHLFKSRRLPSRFHCVAVGRRDWNDTALHRHIDTILSQHSRIGHLSRLSGGREKKSFFSLWTYHRGEFEQENDYRALARSLKTIDDSWGMCSNKIFHLAVPPRLYASILSHLSASGLTNSCGEGGGEWTRVIVEKPFGSDLSSAEELDLLLAQLFRETQIYRIDHYLAKEMLQNILSFRFSNNLFEDTWNTENIESIRIRLHESLDIGKRGAYYDDIGALRDMGQNHVLQILALLTLDRPESYSDIAIRTRRAEALKHLLPLRGIEKNTVRGQYAGYQKSAGVHGDSQTETYFNIRVRLAGLRWKGVAVELESGKALPSSLKEATITYKHPSPCLCPLNGPHYQNKIIFRLEPAEEILVSFWAKKPGVTFEIEERVLKFSYREKTKKSQYIEEYEKLLLDCIAGDQTLFVSTDEVRATWRFVDPIIAAWKSGAPPLVIYEPGTLPGVE